MKRYTSNIKPYEKSFQEEDRLSDVPIEKGKMHGVLGLGSDEKITDKYTSGKALAQALIAKVGKEEATGMINWAANINPSENIFDQAQKVLSEIE